MNYQRDKGRQNQKNEFKPAPDFKFIGSKAQNLAPKKGGMAYGMRLQVWSLTRRAVRNPKRNYMGVSGVRLVCGGFPRAPGEFGFCWAREARLDARNQIGKAFQILHSKPLLCIPKKSLLEGPGYL